MVACSFIYPCWIGTACCSLLTCAETQWIRQLLIHEVLIISINMVITRICRGISQLKISSCQEMDPPKRDCGHPENSPACSLRYCRIWMFFLRTVRVFFNLAGGICPENTRLIQDGSSPSLFRDQEIYLLLILEYNPCQAMLALQSYPEKAYPQKLDFGSVWHSFVVLNRYLRSPRGSQVYWVSSSVFFHAWLMSSESRSHVLYLDCCGGRKCYRVGAFHVGWSWAFGDPSF